MPVVSSVDPKWASTLVGLPLKVPECWWAGYSGSKRYSGRIASVDLNEAAGRYYLFETDEDPGTPYPMRYDAVREYADKGHSSFKKFDLPARARKAKKRKAATRPAKPVPADVKKDASKLLNLISGDGVDFMGDMKELLTKGDTKAVALLKSMYSLDEVKECLLCGEKCVPEGKKCVLYHNITWDDYERDWPHPTGRGVHSGKCWQCGDRFSYKGREGECPPKGCGGKCYNGNHVFTDAEKEKILIGLWPDLA